MKYIFLLVLIAFSFSACDIAQKEESPSENKKKKQLPVEAEGEKNTDRKKIPVIDYEFETNSTAQILNNIIVYESGGLKASRVYLAYEDGRLVPKTNRVALNTPINLVFLIKDGWEVKNGMVSLDASEKIATNNGELVLNVTSLFKSTPPMKKTDASQISLKASIKTTRADIDYYIVHYRLWDKKGEGEIKGSYKLYIDAEIE